MTAGERVAEEARAARVAGLRERIARMGGLMRPARDTAEPGMPGAMAGAVVDAAAPHRGPPAPEPGPGGASPGRFVLRPPDGLGPSLGALGFVPEANSAGLAWVRRVSVELTPFLDAAAAPRPASPGQLLHLAAGTHAPQDASAWLEDEVAVLDIESLGLHGSGVVAFLVGVGVPRGSRLEIDQLLLADLGEEPAQLVALLDRLARCRMVVTYNGRTFDLPVLRARAIVNRLHGWSAPPLHCDLLSPVRRLFRDRLGACTLRQAEQMLLGLHREGDVPGSEAPARYRAWQRSGIGEVIEGVVHHNQLDLCATMVLAARLAAHVEGRLVQPPHPADRYRLGVHLERRGGVADEVDDHLRSAVIGARPPWSREAALRLAHRLRRRDGISAHAEAVSLLRRLVNADAEDLRAARQLAIALERAGEAREAVAVCHGALAACTRIGDWRLNRMRGAPASGWRSDWERRCRRLRVRLERAESRRRCGDARGQRPPPGDAAGEGAAAVTPPLFAY